MTTEQVRIVVGSTNPVKAAAIAGAYEKLFPGERHQMETVSVPSGVPDQPMSDGETLRGARNRAMAARDATPHADLWAGLEGGIEHTDDGGMRAFAWIVCLTANRRGEARTATFPIPPGVAKLVHDGVELGYANDRIFGLENSKHHAGAIGILTDGIIDRRALYEHAALMAMVPLRQTTLFLETEPPTV